MEESGKINKNSPLNKLNITKDQNNENEVKKKKVVKSKGKKVKNENVEFPNAEDYEDLDPRSHAYLRPDTYIGSDAKYAREELLFDPVERKFYRKLIDYPDGCERIYIEIITNAADNVGKSRRNGYKAGEIEIKMNKKTVSVKNYGLPIPIEKSIDKKTGKVRDIYVPEMIFGTMFSGSNYKGDQHEAGKNGIGAKATNIFSKQFEIWVYDHVRKLSYYQIWRNNMLEKEKPVIEKYKGKVSSVEVKYTMDFERFGYKTPSDDEEDENSGYTKDIIDLYAKNAVDISFTTKVPVKFNDELFNYSNIKDFGRLHFGEKVNNSIIHYEWPEGTEIKTKKNGDEISKNGSIIPLVELLAIDNPNNGGRDSNISFVNSLFTPEGGIHVATALKVVGDPAIKVINEAVSKKLSKNGGDLDKKDKRMFMLTMNEVKDHISIIISVRVTNPSFTSQNKTQLKAPAPKITINENKFKIMSKWQLIDELQKALQAKQFASLTKNDGKMKKHVTTKKGVDAGDAGTKYRSECTLLITEGDSGAGYAEKFINNAPGGRKRYGVLPLKGKSLNVMNSSLIKVAKNQEINELMKMLGLKYCNPDEKDTKDTYYLNEKNFKELRYGKLLIMADSDVDGKHIIGLILNYFYWFFPSLLVRDYVSYYQTPILRIKKGKVVKKFYTPFEYDRWKESTPEFVKWKHHYYKGLGTSTKPEIKDDYATQRNVCCIYDENTAKSMHTAFDKNFADIRKLWIKEGIPKNSVYGTEKFQKLPISWFIDFELKTFSIDDTLRSLPNLMDGLKISQRKLLFGAYKKWNIKLNGKYEKFKVAQFGTYATEQSNYHHGETNLNDVIIKMAQSFTGSNNSPWFTEDGNFGSRFYGGNDAAAPRYIFTRPHNLLSLICRTEDLPILEYLWDEGSQVEPVNYFPIIPMVLVNGSKGIGTGWSSTVPNFNPNDIIDWLIARINNKDVDDIELIPWYAGFKGNIKLIDKRKYKKSKLASITERANNSSIKKYTAIVIDSNPDDERLPGEENLNIDNDSDDLQAPEFSTALSVQTEGSYYIVPNSDKIIIEELPIGCWSFNYYKWLEELKENKKIADFTNLSVDDKVRFEIIGFKDTANLRNLKLIKTISMSNMVLLDGNNPIHYETVYDILETFYQKRLPIYHQRRNYMIATIKKEITKFEYKIKLIRAVRSKKLVFMDRSKAQIYEDLKLLDIPKEIYDEAHLHHFTTDDINNLENTILNKQKILEDLENTSPETMWINDLKELQKCYNKYYKSFLASLTK